MKQFPSTFGVSRFAAASTAVVCLVLPASATAANTARNLGARRAVPPSISVFTPFTKFKSSTNRNLWADLDVTGANSISDHPSLTVSVTDSAKLAYTFVAGRRTSVASGYELHGWSFQLTNAAFSASEKNGTATLSTGTQINPFGSISLAFSKSSKAKAVCKTSGSETVYKATVKGTFFFNTNSSTWGSAGSKSKKANFSTATTMTFDHNCTNPTPPTTVAACQKSIDWTAPSGGGRASIFGSSYGGAGSMTLSGFVSLSMPKDASRSDLASETSPVPTLSGSTVSVTTAGNQVLFSGKAKLTESKTKYPVTSKCKLGKKTMTETDTTYLNSAYVAGKPKLTAKPNISAPNTPSGKGGSVTVWKYS